MDKQDKFVIKDSGQRKQFASGMQRDVTEGKIDFTLILDGPMFKRWAIHLTNGAKKYDKRNWMKASGNEELDRFRESALRHFYQWIMGERDEDHGAAVFFNINAAEYVIEKLAQENKEMKPARVTIQPTGVTTSTIVPTTIESITPGRVWRNFDICSLCGWLSDTGVFAERDAKFVCPRCQKTGKI